MEQQTIDQQQQQQQQIPDPLDRQFNDECLTAHNSYRDLHGCPPLKFSAKLARRAQAWADHLASVGYLKHSPNAAGNFGENVALKVALGSREYRGSQAAAQWYSEIEMYEFDGAENQARCGHFSQVVWKETRKVGFGKAVSQDGKMFAVGQYIPPGNMMNCWIANIPAPLSGHINIPSHEDVMGADEDRAASRKITSTSSLVDDSNPAGRLLLTASQEFGDLSRLEPKPKDPADKQIGKSIKTRIINGEKSLIMTLTFMRPDGSRYQLSADVALRDSDLLPSNAGRGSNGVLGNGVIHAGNGGEDDDDDAADGFSPSRFSAEMLLAHNQIRSRHGSQSLRRSESLERLAQTWSERMASDGRMRRCDLPEVDCLGQSIAKRPGDFRPPSGQLTGTGLGPAAQLARQWYTERLHFQFRFGGAPKDEETGRDINGGHFSQIVWQSTEKLGVGCTVDKTTGDAYVVCLYQPSGNIAGKFVDNVLPAYD